VGSGKALRLVHSPLITVHFYTEGYWFRATLMAKAADGAPHGVIRYIASGRTLAMSMSRIHAGEVIRNSDVENFSLRNRPFASRACVSFSFTLTRISCIFLSSSVNCSSRTACALFPF